MKLTDTSLTRRDKVWETIFELKNRHGEWFSRTELHLLYDKGCISPDRILECNIYLRNTSPWYEKKTEQAGGGKTQKIIFVAIETKTCGEKVLELLETHRVMNGFFTTGSILYDLDIRGLFAKSYPTQQWIADEIDKLKVDVQAYLSELGYEFVDGETISRSVDMPLPVFFESWGL